MLTGDRCQVMLPNSTQCPNGVIDMGATHQLSKLQADLDPNKCLLHNQLDIPQNDNNVVDETNENVNTIPADKG